MAKPKKRKTDKDTHVFATDSKQITADSIKKLGVDLSGRSFDPIEVTYKIIEFGKALTGIPLYQYQHDSAFRIIFSTICVEGATLSMLFARQSGKTETLAFCAATLTVILPALATIFPELEQYKDGIKIGLFAPQSDQVDTTYMRALTRLGTENAHLIMGDPEVDVELTSDVRLELTNGSFMAGQVASKTSKIESKTYDLIFIEEAQDMETFIVQKSIEPMTSATNGTIVKVGTTGTFKGDFYTDIQFNIRKSRTIKDPRLKMHYQYDYKEVIRQKRAQYDKDKKLFHLNYEKNVLQRRARLGEDSDAFRLAYALIWALDSGMFLTDKMWNNMINRKKGFATSIKSSWNICAGLDIAKSTASTVLTIGRSWDNDKDDYSDVPLKEVLFWIELKGVDYEAQHNLIMDALIEWEVETLYADYTGVGKPVVDRLMFACGEYVNIIPYTFSRPSKSEMWQALDADIRAGRMTIPANQAVRASEEFKSAEEQLRHLQKWYEGSYLVAEKSEGYLDDYADSLALFTLAGNEAAPEEAEVIEGNPLFGDIGGMRSMMDNGSFNL